MPVCRASRCARRTEWVETVDTGWNTLVDLDADSALSPRSSGPSPPSDPSCTATATPPSAPSPRSTNAMSTGPGRRRRPRLLGPEPRAQHRRDRRRELAWLCDGDPQALARVAAQHPRQCTGTGELETCSPTRRSTPSCSPRPSRHTPSWPCGYCRRASTASSRSRSRPAPRTPNAPSPRPRRPTGS